MAPKVPLLITLLDEEANEQGIQEKRSEHMNQQWTGNDLPTRATAEHLGEKEGKSCSKDKRGRKTGGTKKDEVAEENKNFFDDFSDSRNNTDSMTPVPFSPDAIDDPKINLPFSVTNTGCCCVDSLELLNRGAMVNLPDQVLESAEDDEATACSVQGMVFHDEELGWCIVTNWGVDGTNIIYYTSITSANPITDEQHTSLSEFLSLVKHVPVVLLVGLLTSNRL